MNKKCVKCGEDKDEELFPTQQSKLRKDGTRLIYRKTVCRICENKRREDRRKRNGISEKSQRIINTRERNKRWVSNNPDKVKIIQRKSQILSYGITLEDYDKMLTEQEYFCKICGKHESDTLHKVLDIDHCHSSGKVRGLLCNACNVMIARGKDSPELLRKAADYLEYKV